uniref:Ubiquinone biosynthesis monooxygenase COQ6, mitochondrial n=1 Tax=Parascaris univalens TaxID=6257 RepID=A0A915B4T1_PARUN
MLNGFVDRLSYRSIRLTILRRNYSTKGNIFYDTVIVGGGMVGNAMACSMGLSKTLSSKKVLLIESGDPKPLVKTPIYSNRVSAISPPSVAFFKKLGIWENLEKYRIKRVDRLEVIDSCSRSAIRFEQSDPANEIAYIVENNAIVALLSDRIRERCNNVEIKTKTKVENCVIPNSLAELVNLKLNDGTEISTSLIIGADGVNSQIRQSFDVDYTSWEYGQKGVVATLQIQAEDDNSAAWQRFSKYGPIALLPLSGNLSSLVWTTSDEHAEYLLSLTPEQFVDELNHYLTTDASQSRITNQVLSVVEGTLNSLCDTKPTRVPIPPTVIALQSDTRAAFPLGFGHAHSYVAPRVALIGDAAHRIHPLAGQGVNLGWADVRKLIGCLERSIHDGADLGALTYLSEYDSEGQRHNVPVQVVCDWLNRLYRTEATPIVLIRSLGLFAVNRLTLVKDFIVHQTSSE